MPHLLRSTTPLRSTTAHDVRQAQVGSPSPEVDHDPEPLRVQVSAILDAILSDTKTEEAHVRERLRRHVANNPGQPEKALLKHLMSVSAEQDAG